MVRRAGRFQAPKVVEFPPQEGDAGEALESKWRNWVKQESFKRYALNTRTDLPYLTASTDWLYICFTGIRDLRCRC